ncbi:MAG: sulfatase-like hydrolase/transferase [Verrucomicrobiota bacterium JB024]|nr:sulfatase-like hydrolase/transferase [Verrucomicrobiota bacterium JB024]
MKSRPLNILVLICDQLSAQAMRAWGNRFASTPHLDSLIASGMRFESCYTTCPLCQPSRASFWTSRYPHQTGVLSNGGHFADGVVGCDVATLGATFSEAGYASVHFGKQHDAGSLRGFDCSPISESETNLDDPSLLHTYDTRQDRFTRERAVEFLRTFSGDDRPFLAVVDFNNPHNICDWIGDNQGEGPLKKRFSVLPELPGNLFLDDAELRRRPLPIQYLASAHRRQSQISHWDEDKIRHYLHAYHYYLSLVDAEIGQVLKAIYNREDADETLIVFYSDHGDALCGRWMATKHTSFYEETMHVPLAFSGAKIKTKGRSISGLCSLLDITPTLCTLAGITPPENMQGKTLHRAIMGDSSSIDIHSAVYGQWHTEWGNTIEPGRMVRSVNYKYTHYREGYGEELYDLREDPGETRNLVLAPQYLNVLQEHRSLLDHFILSTDDPYWSLHYKVDPIFREAYLTYRNYSGCLACDVGSTKPAK